MIKKYITKNCVSCKKPFQASLYMGRANAKYCINCKSSKGRAGLTKL